MGGSTSSTRSPPSDRKSPPSWWPRPLPCPRPLGTLLGNVVTSVVGSPYNTIDPGPFYDAEADRLWMTFGSFWKGIYIVELDPLNPTVQLSAPTFLAGGRPGNNAIEASYVFRHGDYFYLNASVDKCCAGSSSTYKQIIGRSHSITGPYLDRDGVDLREGGGTVFLAGGGAEVGARPIRAVFAGGCGAFYVSPVQQQQRRRVRPGRTGDGVGRCRVAAGGVSGGRAAGRLPDSAASHGPLPACDV